MLMRSYAEPDITLWPLSSDPSFKNVKIFFRFEANQSTSSGWRHETKPATIDKFKTENRTRFPFDMLVVL